VNSGGANDDRECKKEMISVLNIQMYISACRVYVNWKTCLGSAVDRGGDEQIDNQTRRGYPTHVHSSTDRDRMLVSTDRPVPAERLSGTS